jgi:outer membrane protein OmpA-like peptidoglycan-associated protein
MRRYAIATVCIALGAFVVFVLPHTPYAQQKEKYTDFRNRQYSAEDLEQALIPAKTRGPVSKVSQEKNTVALNVFFETNSDQILPKYYEDLNKLGEVLTRHPDYRFQIEGHTDSVGSEPYNQVLSEKRATSIRKYLVQNFSITPERLQTVGLGEARPRATNNTDEGRSVNRRVEFVNLGK